MNIDFNPLQAYEERVYDPGYPYFYKAAIPKRGTPVRNALLGKALAADLLYPIALYSVVARRKDKVTKILTGSTIPTRPSTTPTASFYQGQPVANAQGAATPLNLANRITIYRISEDYVLQNGVEPYLQLDFVPEKLDVKVQAEQKDVGVVGLNLPHYHYGGSAEVISFVIDWYDFKPGARDRLLTRCEKVKVLAQADGYSASTPLIGMDWAGSAMFKNKIFVVESANYTFDTFLAFRQEYNKTKEFNHLNPLHARQEVVIKRVGGQQTSKTMIDASIQ